MKYRLIELIQNAVGGCSRHWAGLIADALIAHGVTFATDNNVGGKRNIRPIDAYTLAEEIESLQVTVGGKPAHWYDAKHTVLRMIAEQPDVPETNVGKWIPVSERLPEFYVNEDGCYCTRGKLVFRSGWDKTVHIGYCIKLIYIINIETLETIETIEWYDDGGHKWENITHWLPLPPKEGE